MTTQTLVDFIKAYAVEHYEDGGWDVIHECWSDKDIADYLSTFLSVTEAEAVAAFESGVVGIWADRQAEARYQGEQ